VSLGLANGLPWMPLDEQFDETKTFGFVGDQLRAGIINQASHCINTVPVISAQMLASFGADSKGL
jgi:hypothetical protein